MRRLDGITDSMDMSLSKLWGLGMCRWAAGCPRVGPCSCGQLTSISESDRASLQSYLFKKLFLLFWYSQLMMPRQFEVDSKGTQPYLHVYPFSTSHFPCFSPLGPNHQCLCVDFCDCFLNDLSASTLEPYNLFSYNSSQNDPFQTYISSCHPNLSLAMTSISFRTKAKLLTITSKE